MLERNILIVDDSRAIDEDIKSYNYIFQGIKKEKGLDYVINFTPTGNYDKAINMLTSDKIFDVVLIDYDLSMGGSGKTGDELVKSIRESINKHCKIIFYTMSNLQEVFPDRNDLVNLFNLGIYKFVTKDLKTQNPKRYGPPANQLRVEAIIEAIESIDIVQLALERYFQKYLSLTNEDIIYVDGEDYSIEDIINAIRKDLPVGKSFRENLMQSVLIDTLLRGNKA
ncbi:hypothetical protein V6C32_11410 [Desulforamulus ruminis]|uniref:hypothetical protein n=1 Tax=Desulforamulus ruminis TaxID=1564 RepID=UPI002FD9DB6B